MAYDVIAPNPSIHSLHFAGAFLSLFSILFRVFLPIHRKVLVTTHRARVHENVDRLAERVFSCKTSGKGLSFSFFSNLAQTRGNLSIVALYVYIRSLPSIPHALRSSRRQRATIRVAIRNVRDRRCDSMKSKYARVRRKDVGLGAGGMCERKNIDQKIRRLKWRNNRTHDIQK